MNTLAGTTAILSKNSIAEKIKQNSEKCGSIKNVTKYGFKQYANIRKTQAKDAFVTTAGLAATVGAAAVVSKSAGAQNLIQKGLDYVKNSNIAQQTVTAVKEIAKKAAPYLTKAATWVGDLPAPAKAVLVGGTLITAIASNIIRNKGMQQQGAILKEMEISAKLEKQQAKESKDLLG